MEEGEREADLFVKVFIWIWVIFAILLFIFIFIIPPEVEAETIQVYDRQAGRWYYMECEPDQDGERYLRQPSTGDIYYFERLDEPIRDYITLESFTTDCIDCRPIYGDPLFEPNIDGLWGD